MSSDLRRPLVYSIFLPVVLLGGLFLCHIPLSRFIPPPLPLPYCSLRLAFSTSPNSARLRKTNGGDYEVTNSPSRALNCTVFSGRRAREDLFHITVRESRRVLCRSSISLASRWSTVLPAERKKHTTLTQNKMIFCPHMHVWLRPSSPNIISRGTTRGLSPGGEHHI